MVVRVLIVSLAIILAGCDAGPKGSAGFTLPDGDVERGKADYIALRCHTCHQHSAVPQLHSGAASEISIVLGGTTTRVRTYGELVTSIINPSHRVARRHSPQMADERGRSKMVSFNDVMTVTQLIDVVAFVQASYTLIPYQHTNYPDYQIPEPAANP